MTSKRMGVSLDAAPAVKEAEREDKPVRPTTKQTIEIGRKAYGRIRAVCSTRGISFQDFAIEALNLRLNEAGEPSVEELEAAE